jgi:hypothetical protein
MTLVFPLAMVITVVMFALARCRLGLTRSRH